MTSYTYLIGWTKLDRYYYGVRYSKKADPRELFTTYFTSSRHVTKFIEENGLPDRIEIRRIFESSTAARDWEHRVLKRMKVIHSEKWLNHTDNRAFSDEANRNSAIARKGGKKSPEARAKMSETRRRMYAEGLIPLPGPYSEERRAAISAGLVGRALTPEHREKLRRLRLGKKQSPETVAKRRATWLAKKQGEKI